MLSLPTHRVLEIEQTTPNLEELIAAVPDSPAVFAIWPASGAPYIARTTTLRRRLRRLLRERDQPSRLLNLRAVARRIEYWPIASRLESTLVLYHLARRHFPDSYQRMLKLRMPPYVKLILSNPFPRCQVTSRLAAAPDAVYFGPFVTRQAAEQFEAGLLDTFQIRRCSEDLEPSPEHPGCVYGEMNLCLRPCQLAVSREEYMGEVGRVRAFLNTGGSSMLSTIAAARDRFSDELNFEEAARQHKRLQKVEQVVKSSGELSRDIETLNAIALTRADSSAVSLWFLWKGCWQAPVRFGFEVTEGKTESLDHRLRDIVASFKPRVCSQSERQEHLALLARWYYSSWCDGELVHFNHFDDVPYRRLVHAISRVASAADPTEKA